MTAAGRRRAAQALAGTCLVAGLCGCDVLRTISIGAYRNAAADGSVAELRKLGITLEGKPRCLTPDTGSRSLVRLDCTARTSDGRPVVITGVVTGADSANPREDYVITVGGREVLHKPCLNLGCPTR